MYFSEPGLRPGDEGSERWGGTGGRISSPILHQLFTILMRQGRRVFLLPQPTVSQSGPGDRGRLQGVQGRFLCGAGIVRGNGERYGADERRTRRYERETERRKYVGVVYECVRTKYVCLCPE